MDDACVKLYGLAQCTAWAEQYPIKSILFDAFEQRQYDLAVFGKIDIGAGCPERFPNSTGGADHVGVELRSVPRGADLRLDSMGVPSWESDNNAGPSPSDSAIASEAVQWLQARAANASGQELAPFFLYASILVPHFPFVTGAEWLAAVNDSAVQLPTWQPLADMHPYDAHMSVSKGCARDTEWEPSDILELRKVYLAMAAQSDAVLGSILQAAESGGFMNDTLIVFWSDHGEMAFEARQVYKNSFREPSARVPLLFAGPGIEAGQMISQPVSLIDLWPTLSDLVGIAPAPQARGHSVAPLMTITGRHTEGQQDAPHPGLVAGEYFAENSNTGAFFLRTGDWKYITFGRSFPWFASYRPQLFNITADNAELNDVAGLYPQVVATLDALLVQTLGTDYQQVDAAVMAVDQFMFRTYVEAGKTTQQVQREFNNTYAGWNSSWWERVVLWNSTIPKASVRY
jgi:arylsulfatase A-like enzyme